MDAILSQPIVWVALVVGAVWVLYYVMYLAAAVDDAILNSSFGEPRLPVDPNLFDPVERFIDSVVDRISGRPSADNSSGAVQLERVRAQMARGEAGDASEDDARDALRGGGDGENPLDQRWV